MVRLKKRAEVPPVRLGKMSTALSKRRPTNNISSNFGKAKATPNEIYKALMKGLPSPAEEHIAPDVTEKDLDDDNCTNDALPSAADANKYVLSESLEGVHKVVRKRKRTFNGLLVRGRGKNNTRVEKSKGAEHKCSGTVLKAFNDHYDSKKQPNVCCRIETFGRIVSYFEDDKKKIVNEMGFGGLLHFAGTRLPRSLCYWLMSRLDPFMKVLCAPDGSQFPLSQNQVNWVLGTPVGGRDVPRKARGPLLNLMNAIKCKYEEVISRAGYNGKGTTIGIPLKTIEEAVTKAIVTEDDEKDFRVTFLMFAIATVLCPTTCQRFPNTLLPAITVYADSANYNWSQLVVDWLLECGEAFEDKFYHDGYVPGIGGCTIYLAILYLDALNRPPLKWGVFPRIKVWTVEEVNCARSEDRLPTGDFGAIGTISVAYGKRHPMEARDTPYEGPGTTGISQEILACLLPLLKAGSSVELSSGLFPSTSLLRQHAHWSMQAEESISSDTHPPRRQKRKATSTICPHDRWVEKMKRTGRLRDVECNADDLGTNSVVPDNADAVEGDGALNQTAELIDSDSSDDNSNNLKSRDHGNLTKNDEPRPEETVQLCDKRNDDLNVACVGVAAPTTGVNDEAPDMARKPKMDYSALNETAELNLFDSSDDKRNNFQSPDIGNLNKNDEPNPEKTVQLCDKRNDDVNVAVVDETLDMGNPEMGNSAFNETAELNASDSSEGNSTKLPSPDHRELNKNDEPSPEETVQLCDKRNDDLNVPCVAVPATGENDEAPNMGNPEMGDSVLNQTFELNVPDSPDDNSNNLKSPDHGELTKNNEPSPEETVQLCDKINDDLTVPCVAVPTVGVNDEAPDMGNPEMGVLHETANIICSLFLYVLLTPYYVGFNIL